MCVRVTLVQPTGAGPHKGFQFLLRFVLMLLLGAESLSLFQFMVLRNCECPAVR